MPVTIKVMLFRQILQLLITNNFYVRTIKNIFCFIGMERMSVVNGCAQELNVRAVLINVLSSIPVESNEV